MSLALGMTPHRADEVEVTLTDHLGPLRRHDAGATQREVRVAQRQSRDVRETALVPLDQTAAGALDRIAAGLVGGLARRDVALDLAEREIAKDDPRPYGEREPHSRRADHDDLAAHVMRPAGEVSEHRDRVSVVAGLADPRAVELDLGVRREGDLAGSRDGIGLRSCGRAETRLVHIGGRDHERDTEEAQELEPARRARSEAQHARYIRTYGEPQRGDRDQ